MFYRKYKRINRRNIVEIAQIKDKKDKQKKGSRRGGSKQIDEEASWQTSNTAGSAFVDGPSARTKLTNCCPVHNTFAMFVCLINSDLLGFSSRLRAQPNELHSTTEH